ncbi:MAG: hypothetical protein Ta2A_09300 [Treponemataceae bacterium]|nr:MAG: hypothetical protein Ta2A_09300 [Treponemataceae bacterium]
MGEKSYYLIISLCILFFYCIQRLAIHGCFREYLRYGDIKKIRSSKNTFYKLTGLYLLFIKQGQSVFLKIALILTNIQLLFIPVLLILLACGMLGINFFIEKKIISKIISIVFWEIESLLIAIHYFLKIRFKKK